MAGLLLVEQDEVGFQFDGKRESFSLTPVEISAESHHQSLLSDLMAPDP